MFNMIFIFVQNAEFGLRMQLSGRVLRHGALDSNSSISKEKKKVNELTGVLCNCCIFELKNCNESV